jgi:hypothetical protein
VNELKFSNNSTRVLDNINAPVDISFLAQLVERVTSNDEVSRSSRLEGIYTAECDFISILFLQVNSYHLIVSIHSS